MFQQLQQQALRQARTGKVMATSGVVRPYGPRKLFGIAKTVHSWGIGFAGGIGALAIRAPHEVALIDELGELTWAELDDRATRLAHGLKDLGVGSGRERRSAVSQPPVLRGGLHRPVQARLGHPLPQHRLLPAPAR